MRNFGIRKYVNHAIIKINCRLTREERMSLIEAYPMLRLEAIDTRRAIGLTRIEGCMDWHLYIHSFAKEKTLAIKRSKIALMQLEVDLIEAGQAMHTEVMEDACKHITFNEDIDPLDELPF